MKNYLIKNLHKLQILTAISFLILYKSGDTMSAFVFMVLVVLPFFIANNATGIVDITQNTKVNIFVNLFLIAIIYWAVYYSLRPGNIHSKSIKSRFLYLLSIVIFCGYAISLFWRQTQTVFSATTIVIFILCSFLNLIGQLLMVLEPTVDAE